MSLSITYNAQGVKFVNGVPHEDSLAYKVWCKRLRIIRLYNLIRVKQGRK